MRICENDDKVLVTCPFYKWHERKRVSCEGMSEGRSFGQQFSSEMMCTRYLVTKCSSEYKLCPIYTMLMREKYPEALE